MGKFYISKQDVLRRVVRLAAAIGCLTWWGWSETTKASGFSSAAGLRTPHGSFRSYHGLSKRAKDPIYTVAARHHWNGTQVRYWLDVLWRESTSSLGHYRLWAVNGSCVGIGQLNGGWGAYAHYGGSSGTALGQLTGDAGYIKGRYGTPAAAWEHEESYGWY